MEIFFDGFTIVILGKSGVHGSMTIHPFFILLTILGAVLWFTNTIVKADTAEQKHPLTKALAALALLALPVFIVAVLNSFTCNNPISCSWHPRADMPETWMISPDRLVYEAYERELR